jgi:PST family polysaccharide transporter
MKESVLIIKNLFSLTFAEAASKGLLLVSTMLLARNLSPDGFGELNFINSIIIYFIYLTNFGIENIAIRETAKLSLDRNAFVNSVLSLRLLLSSLSYIMLIIYINTALPATSNHLAWYIAGANIFSNGLLMNWYYLGTEKMEIIALRQFITGVLNLVGIYLFINSSDDTLLAIIIMAVSLLLNTVWMIGYYVRSSGKINFSFNIERYRDIIRSALPIGFSFLIVVIYNNFCMNLIPYFKGNYENGIYAASYKLMMAGIIPSGIIQSAFFPLLSRQDSPDDRDRVMNRFTLSLFLSGTIMACLLFFFNDLLIHLTVGDKFQQSAGLLRYLSVGLIFQYLSISFSAPLFAWKKEKFVLYATLTGGVVNISLNLLLIPSLGAKGAGITIIISELIVAIVMGFNYFRMTGHLYMMNFTKALSASFFPCLAGYGLVLLGINDIIAILSSLILFVITILSFKLVNISELIKMVRK